jgi:hypothetical protein
MPWVGRRSLSNKRAFSIVDNLDYVPARDVSLYETISRFAAIFWLAAWRLPLGACVRMLSIFLP